LGIISDQMAEPRFHEFKGVAYKKTPLTRNLYHNFTLQTT